MPLYGTVDPAHHHHHRHDEVSPHRVYIYRLKYTRLFFSNIYWMKIKISFRYKTLDRIIYQRIVMFKGEGKGVVIWNGWNWCSKIWIYTSSNSMQKACGNTRVHVVENLPQKWSYKCTISSQNRVIQAYFLKICSTIIREKKSKKE